jgi:hypothetical protein
VTVPFCSEVTRELAEVVQNDAMHSGRDLSDRASRLLDQIVANQPPAIVERKSDKAGSIQRFLAGR